MNRIVPNGKFVVFCLLSLALGAAVALGGTKAGAPKLPEAAVAFARAEAAAKNRRALEAYEKRNAEIAPWADGAAPKTADNAALLYYQAFLLRPEPNEAMKYEIYPSTEPTRQIRTYLGHCLPMIEIVETASRIPGCIWGVWPEGGPSWAPLRRNIGLIVSILLVDAETLAADGHYRVALERCLTVRRLARHVSEDSALYRHGTGPDTLALSTIRSILSVMPPDADIVTWLRGQFTVVPGPRLSYAKTLRGRVRVELYDMRTNPDFLRQCKDSAVREAEGQQAKEDVRNLTDKKFLSRVREGLARFTDSILRILDSEMTYEQKLAQMHELVDEKMKDDTTDPVIKGIIGSDGVNIKGQINVTYPPQVAHAAHVNGTRAAVEMYLILAKTGQLPEKLPSYLPKDPFTGRDFGYEITKEGFTLRCQGKDFLTRKKSLLEFKVRK
ncbi:MAG: hypothetical protein ACYSW0_18975 [Planctomycetota bacterium]|jgi:hypothetical protein